MRRLTGAVVLASLLILFPWGSLPDLGQRIAGWFGDAPQQAVEETVQVVEVAELPASDVVVAAVDEVGIDSGVGMQTAATGAPGYATTQPLELEVEPPALPDAIATAPLLPGDDSPLGPTLAPTPWIGLPGGPAIGPSTATRPPAIAAGPGGGFGSPPGFSPPSRGTPPVNRAPGGNGPAPLAPTAPAAPPVSDLPIASVPNTPAAPSVPESPIASLPNTPANGPGLVDLPAQLDDPVIVSNTAPEDSWYSPGHSPGILEVDGPFLLDGRTLLFEILGTEAGVEYDQLIVTGDATLDSGNVVFAFIDGYTPTAADLFKLIMASSIDVDFDNVDFYYGFFDTPYNLHAPYDLNLYSVWDPASGIAMLDADGVVSPEGNQIFDDFFGIQYVTADPDFEPVAGPNETITPIAIGAEVPAPAPLLLLATGLLAAGSFRRLRRG